MVGTAPEEPQLIGLFLIYLSIRRLKFGVYILTPEDGGSMFLRNAGIYLTTRKTNIYIFTTVWTSNLTSHCARTIDTDFVNGEVRKVTRRSKSKNLAQDIPAFNLQRSEGIIVCFVPDVTSTPSQLLLSLHTPEHNDLAFATTLTPSHLSSLAEATDKCELTPVHP
jgi:hypothetical protein